MTYLQLFALAISLHQDKKMGVITRTLQHEWRNENQIIKHLPDQERDSLIADCLEHNATIEPITQTKYDQEEDYIGFLITFEVEKNRHFKIEIS